MKNALKFAGEAAKFSAFGYMTLVLAAATIVQAEHALKAFKEVGK